MFLVNHRNAQRVEIAMKNSLLIVGWVSLILLFCSCNCVGKRLFSSTVQEEEYRQLIQKFNTTQEMENVNFAKLVFQLKPEPPMRYRTFKLMLIDQLGRDWIFKANEQNTVEGALVTYRWFKMFGLFSPEIHPKKIKINEKWVDGTMQRYVKNSGGLDGVSFQDFSDEAIEYYAKNHVMSWLIAGHHVHPNQFIVIKEPSDKLQKTNEKIKQVIRIDNSIEWYLLGHDRLDINYMTPILLPTLLGSRNGYYSFWRAYLNGKIEVPFQKIYDWAGFVSDFPDDVYRSFFSQGVARNFDTYGNNGVVPESLIIREFLPDLYLRRIHYEDVIPTFLKRKNELRSDLKKLYENVSLLRHTPVDLSELRENRALFGEYIRNQSLHFDERLKELQAESRQLSAFINHKTQDLIDLNIEASLEAFREIRPCLTELELWGRRNAGCLIRLLKTLQALQTRADLVPVEKEAIQHAVENTKCFIAYYFSGNANQIIRGMNVIDSFYFFDTPKYDQKKCKINLIQSDTKTL